MKNYLQVTLLTLSSIAFAFGNSSGQLSVENASVNAKSFPKVIYTFSLMDKNGRLASTPDLPAQTILTDSSNGLVVPNVIVTGTDLHSGDTLQKAQKADTITYYDTTWFPAPPPDDTAFIATTRKVFIPVRDLIIDSSNGLALMIGIDLSDSAVACYQTSDMRYVKSVLRRIVAMMDFTHDKLAIQVVGDEAHIAMQWTNNLDSINNAISHIDSWKISADSLLNIYSAISDSTAGEKYYLGKHGISNAKSQSYIFISSATDDHVSKKTTQAGIPIDGFSVSSSIRFKLNDWDPHLGAGIDDPAIKNSYVGNDKFELTGAYSTNTSPWYIVRVDSETHSNNTNDTATEQANIVYNLQKFGYMYTDSQTDASVSFTVPDTTKSQYTFKLSNNEYGISNYFHVLNPKKLSVKKVETFTVSIYPNPSSQILFVISEKEQPFYIFANNGSILASGLTNVAFNLKDVPTGSYLIHLKDGVTAKIMVIK